MSSTRPSSDASIQDYLADIAQLDLRDGFVAPKHDVAKRLQYEIQTRCGSIPAILTAEHAAGATASVERQFISATPSTFTQDTLQQIERISAALKRANAKLFEIAFHNTPSEPNDLGDRIVVAVRYVPKHASSETN